MACCSGVCFGCDSEVEECVTVWGVSCEKWGWAVEVEVELGKCWLPGGRR